MVRRTHQARRQLAQGKDALLVCVALWLAHAARAAFFRLLPQFSYEIQPFSEYIGLWFVLLPGAPLFLEAVGFYDRPTLARRRTTMQGTRWAGSRPGAVPVNTSVAGAADMRRVKRAPSCSQRAHQASSLRPAAISRMCW